MYFSVFLSIGSALYTLLRCFSIFCFLYGVCCFFCSCFLVAPEYVAGVYFVLYIGQVAVVAVGYDCLRLLFK